MKVYREILKLDKYYMRLDNAGIAIPVEIDKEHYDKVVDSLSFLSGNNANTFYPGLNVQNDVMPKEEDFIKVPFRFLTATTVAAGTHRATDFSQHDALKNSVAKLASKPMFFDHDTDLLNWVGIVEATKWTESRTNSDGQVIPAGIDGYAVIDAKTNPKIARGVLMGAIGSNSVTVEFSMVPSHEFTGDDAQMQFQRERGKMKDGRMVTGVVTEIHDYHESSLVWMGADPFSKAYDKDGNLKNVDKTSVYNSPLSKEANFEHANIAWGLNKKEALSLTHKPTVKIDENIIDMKKETLDKLRAKLGLAADAEITDAVIEAITLSDGKLEKLVKAVKEKAGLATEVELTEDKVKELTMVATVDYDLTKAEAAKVTALTKEVTDFKAEIATLKPLADTGKSYVELQRKEAIRLYNVATEGKPQAAVVALFEKATSEELNGLISLHTKGVAVKFSATCMKCHSEDVEFRSSVGGQGLDPLSDPMIEGEDEDPMEMSHEDMYQKYKPTSMDLSGPKRKAIAA